MVLKIDQVGHVLSYGNLKTQSPEMAVALANLNEANRVKAHAVTGRLSSSGGSARVKEFLAVPAFASVDVSGTIGSTKATVDASLALVNDGLAAVFVDANLLAVALGIPTVTNAGGGTAASPIGAITGAGTALTTSAPKADMDVIRIAMNTNMHTAGALVNKVLRAVGHDTMDIETSPDRQPPPDNYGAGSTGAGTQADPVVPGGGSGLAFGGESPFTNPTPVTGESSGTHAATGVTGVELDAAFDVWRDNIETMAARLAVATNTVVALTDSSTGTAGSAMEALTAFPANSADIAVSLAGGTSTDAEMADIRNAVASLFSKANALAAGFGIPTRSYDGLGTVSNTLAAIGAVTAVATGVQFTEMEAWRVSMGLAFDSLAEHVNDIAIVADVTPVSRVVVVASVPFDNPVNPKQEQSQSFGSAGTKFLTRFLTPTPGGAIAVTGGTPADPGQQKADVDITFTEAKNNIATIAATINAIRTSLGGALVKIV